MEIFIASIEWIPVTVSTLLAFGLGWLWYSPKMFYQKWQAGLPTPPKWQAPMWMPMTAQLFGTGLLAIIVNMASSDGHIGHAIIVGLVIIAFIKSNGMYSGKTKKAISIEVGYLVAIVAIMVVVNMWF